MELEELTDLYNWVNSLENYSTILWDSFLSLPVWCHIISPVDNKKKVNNLNPNYWERTGVGASVLTIVLNS